MKNSIIACCFCLLLLGIPIGSCETSDCGCSISNDTAQVVSSSAPWISDADITSLQQQAIDEGWTFTVGKNQATNHSLSDLCGFVEPDNWWTDASFDPCVPITTLPAHFDWRELGGCTSIKDQDGCGSCWAFGTVAPLECNILIRDHKEVDLSEQWLVSCNQNGWGCNGGWWAHDYFQWKMDKSNGTGAVLEKDFPYQAADVPCQGPYSHPYLIDSWHFIGFSQGIPSTDSIKQAIMTYGPVSVSCAVTQAFGAYTGGVFNEDDPHAQINHAVALVGWDDTQGENGVWFLRNSWGPDWGEDGYMRIEYRVCKVGYAACYVNYPVKTKIDISSGLFCVTVGLRNMGNTVTNMVKCNISVNGGILGVINSSLIDTIDSLEPGAVVYERVPCLGFGPLSIMVSVEPENAGRTAKHAEGLLCGLLFIVTRN
jgi:C1A family cysteine protease